MTRRLGIDLVRCAFPIHDRVGGQRSKTLLYEGSLNILDQIANSLLARKEESFREELCDKYFDKSQRAPEALSPAPALPSLPDILRKTETHRASNVRKYARILMPSREGNIQCNYLRAKIDCPIESRPASHQHLFAGGGPRAVQAAKSEFQISRGGHAGHASTGKL
jgi:hypothetical protein